MSYNRVLLEKAFEILKEKVGEEAAQEAHTTIRYRETGSRLNDLYITQEWSQALLQAAVEMYAPVDCDVNSIRRVSDSYYFEVRRSFHVQATVYVEYKYNFGKLYKTDDGNVRVSSMKAKVDVRMGSSSSLSISEATAGLALAKEMIDFAANLELVIGEFPIFVREEK